VCPTDNTRLLVAHELQPGMIIRNKYQIIERIGIGGMGLVYRGRHLNSCESICLSQFMAVHIRKNRADGFRITSRAIDLAIICSLIGPISNGAVGWERAVARERDLFQISIPIGDEATLLGVVTVNHDLHLPRSCSGCAHMIARKHVNVRQPLNLQLGRRRASGAGSLKLEPRSANSSTARVSTIECPRRSQSVVNYLLNPADVQASTTHELPGVIHLVIRQASILYLSTPDNGSRKPDSLRAKFANYIRLRFDGLQLNDVARVHRL
jgi:hypothetical protein